MVVHENTIRPELIDKSILISLTSINCFSQTLLAPASNGRLSFVISCHKYLGCELEVKQKETYEDVAVGSENKRYYWGSLMQSALM